MTDAFRGFQITRSESGASSGVRFRHEDESAAAKGTAADLLYSTYFGGSWVQWEL